MSQASQSQPTGAQGPHGGSQPSEDHATEQLQRELAHLREDVSDLMRTSGNFAREKLDPLEEYVRENPVKSLLIAAGIGGVLGAFLKSGD